MPHLLPRITRVYDALAMTNRQYPFLAYGADWLAFAHLVIAIAFVGPYHDPLPRTSMTDRIRYGRLWRASPIIFGPRIPDFLSRFVALSKFVRLSSEKAACADVVSAV
jgi:hypothetical protein